MSLIEKIDRMLDEYTLRLKDGGQWVCAVAMSEDTWKALREELRGTDNLGSIDLIWGPQPTYTDHLILFDPSLPFGEMRELRQVGAKNFGGL